MNESKKLVTDKEEGNDERLLASEHVVRLLQNAELPELEKFIFQARFALRPARSPEELDQLSSTDSLSKAHRHSLPGACICLSSQGGVRASVAYNTDATPKELAFYAQALQAVLVPTYAALGLDMSTLTSSD